ncbi:MAG: radical SAM protein [Nanoarchaeota archaeon]|nr:radical SAM protein [Nanoarchaeota archaeon]
MLKFIDPNKIFYLSRIFDKKIHNPWSLEIQPTNNCNLSCNFCAYSKRRKSNNVKLSSEVMRELVKSIKNLGVKGVFISGGGEPLCWSSDDSRISDFIVELSKNSDTALITNGVLLNNKNLEASKHCFYAMVSLYNPNYYKNGMTEEMYNRIIGNIKSLVKWKMDVKAKLPFIIIKVIIDKNNYKEVPLIYKEVESLGVDNIVFRYARNYEGETNIEISPQQKKELYLLLKEIKDDIDETKTNILDLAKGITPEKPRSVNTNKPSRCWIVDFGLYGAVDAAGDVYPCLFYLGNKDFSIGNVNNLPLEKIWGSKLHQRIIEKLHKEIDKGICERCRFMRYNEEIEKLKKDFVEAHASFI